MKTACQELIRQLKKRQDESQLDNTRFALRLGVSRAMWELTANEKWQPGMAILSGAAQAFPELEPLVIAALKEIGAKRRRVA